MRREDNRLLRGHGTYVADLALSGQAYAVLVRSDYAHAIIRSIDTARAAQAPGILLVLTGSDPEIASLGRIPWEVAPPAPAGCAPLPRALLEEPLQPILCGDRVRYVGEPVALVVGESEAAAQDAAELVSVDYEPLPAVVDVEEAIGIDAAPIWRSFVGNTYFRFQKGDRDAADAAFATAAHAVELKIANQRLAANPMEPRGYVGAYDAGSGRFVLHAAASKPDLLKRTIARAILRVPDDQIRVVVRDVGGGFGAKNHVYPEQVLVMLAAKRLGRPVRWISQRAETLIADAQGRDQVSYAALALDERGRFLAVKATTVASLGAYLSPRGVVSPTSGGRTLPGVYAIPTAFLDVRAVFTNTVPTAPYRGAGQPEIMFILERLVDCAARRLGVSPAELRRRNLVPATAFPFRNALATVYDSGRFETNLERALVLSEWQDFPRRREGARRRGKLRGIGLSYTIEACGFGVDEEARIGITDDGDAIVHIGTMSNGQGHETTYARIVAEALGIDIDDVTIVQGDTDIVPYGNGTGASRSITVGGSALFMACDGLVAKGSIVAARLLQVDAAHIRFRSGMFSQTDGETSLGWAEISRAARDPALAPDPAKPGLSARYRFNPTNYTFPNGCHVCEVEVDPETGVVTLESYAIVHDVGRAIDAAIVAGQLQGGVAQGIGQALLEKVTYEPETGQVVTGSFLDYAIPRAGDLPAIRVELSEVKSVVNPLGARSCGEAGPTAAPPAVINAIVNALAAYGIEHIEMPATPMRVWQMIRERSGGHAAA